MVQFAVYIPETGRITCTGSCPASHLHLQAGAGEVAIEIPDGISDVTHYLKAGEYRTYPERPGPWAVFDFDAEVWTDPRTETDLAAEAAASLAARRAAMTCSRMQGILALGETRWSAVLAYRGEPTTTFAERAIIDGASVWRRNSENIAFFAWLLGLDDVQVDTLFETAMAIEA